MSARIAPGDRHDLGVPIWLLTLLAARITRGPAPAIFTTLGRARGLFWGWLHFAGRLMPWGRLPRHESELIILRVAHVRGSAYEEAHHRRIGRRVGLDPADLERVKEGPDGPDAAAWSRRERMLLRVTDELLATRDLSDETWTELRAHLDDATTIELLLLVGHYDMLATTLGVLRVPPDPRPAPRSPQSRS